METGIEALKVSASSKRKRTDVSPTATSPTLPMSSGLLLPRDEERSVNANQNGQRGSQSKGAGPRQNQSKNHPSSNSRHPLCPCCRSKMQVYTVYQASHPKWISAMIAKLERRSRKAANSKRSGKNSGANWPRRWPVTKRKHESRRQKRGWGHPPRSSWRRTSTTVKGGTPTKTICSHLKK